MKTIVRTCTSAFLAAMALVSCQKQQLSPEEQFVNDLMQKMTLAEKIGQTNLLPAPTNIFTGISEQSQDMFNQIREGKVGSILNIKGADAIREYQRIAVEESRLGIPILFGLDVIHGYQTEFPIPLAVSCAWDTVGVKLSAQIAAREASTDGIAWTYSPMVDICRDARWGRIAEGNGEDPWLSGLLGAAYVKGWQGDDLSDPQTLMACLKHYALYGAAESGRDYNTTDMSENRMFNEYLLPYQMCVEAGVGSVMTSFNDINGTPATANKWLQDDLLRKQWKFDGFVVTDYGAIREMKAHGLGDDDVVTERALNATVDMDMCSELYITQLEKLLAEKRITEKQIDDACRRVLQAKYRLGLFDDPYRYNDGERGKTELFKAENREAARQITASTFVLLKNDTIAAHYPLLPLPKRGRIALIGPMANNQSQLRGCWSVPSDHTQYSTIFEVMKQRLEGKAEVRYAEGCHYSYDPVLEQRFLWTEAPSPRSHKELLDEALATARWADVVVAILGEAKEMTGEAASMCNIEMQASQHDLLEALVKTGKPVVLLLANGRPMVLKWEQENIPAILDVWFPGSEAGDAICDVLFGDKAPQGHLTTTFPQHVGQVPIYYNHKNTGRPIGENDYGKFTSGYLDVTNAPLYPFGYGLTYTTFKMSDIRLSSSTLTANSSLTASVTLTNTGKREGTTIVQLYTRDLAASVTRPVQELKGFKHVTLQPGESQEVSFEVNAEMLKFYNAQLQYVCEPGDFDLMIGLDCRDVKHAAFALK
ncbi:MAG: beta-glucosidase BglX [Bacteroidales bacterium]|nr:beta-glucosidase BglX [Bacteroidales bacterium]